MAEDDPAEGLLSEVSPKIIDDLSAPTILVDGVNGVIGMPGVVIFNLTQTVLKAETDSSMEAVRTVTARLAVPFGAMPQIVEFMNRQLTRMQEDGTLDQN
ncbi:MAG: hypothetical protein P8I56_09935 [Paracoccaceae bacterium]|nr:hypothetical protein [Paracoccaceae bacterium]